MSHKVQMPSSSAPSLGGGFIPRYGVRGYLSPDAEPGASTPAAQPADAAAGSADKTFSQEDVNRIAAERAQREQRALLGKLGVQNLDEAAAAIKRARELETQAEAARLKKLEDEGKLAELLEETRTKKDAEIAARDAELARLKDEARQEKMTLALERLCARAVKPDQAALLLKASGALRYDEQGRLYVDDGHGKQKLDAKGNPLSVDAFVSTWFAENPHLVSAQGSQSQVIQRGAQQGSAQMIPGSAAAFDESRRNDLNYLRQNGPAARDWLRQKQKK